MGRCLSCPLLGRLGLSDDCVDTHNLISLLRLCSKRQDKINDALLQNEKRLAFELMPRAYVLCPRVTTPFLVRRHLVPVPAYRSSTKYDKVQNLAVQQQVLPVTHPCYSRQLLLRLLLHTGPADPALGDGACTYPYAESGFLFVYQKNTPKSLWVSLLHDL